jgi:hypothetical protein
MKVAMANLGGVCVLTYHCAEFILHLVPSKLPTNLGDGLSASLTEDENRKLRPNTTTCLDLVVSSLSHPAGCIDQALEYREEEGREGDSELHLPSRNSTWSSVSQSYAVANLTSLSLRLCLYTQGDNHTCPLVA